MIICIKFGYIYFHIAETVKIINIHGNLKPDRNQINQLEFDFDVESIG